MSKHNRPFDPTNGSLPLPWNRPRTPQTPVHATTATAAARMPPQWRIPVRIHPVRRGFFGTLGATVLALFGV
jgi:hypothetical protein